MFPTPIRLSRFRSPAALALLLLSAPLQAELVSLPLQVDFPLLRQLLINQLFDNETLSTELLHDPSGCSEIVLSDPRLGESEGHLRIVGNLRARLAIKMMNRCMPLLAWDGFARIVSDPVINADNPRVVSLQVIDSQLISSDDQVMTSGALWDQARAHIHPLFDRFRLDLTSSIDELQRFLPLFLPRHSHQQLQDMLSSIRLSELNVAADGIHSQLQFTIESIAPAERPEHPLTEAEQVLWEQKWQSMDALLTNAIKQYAAATELQELRQTLFDILLDARYRLLEASQQEHGEDPLRHWFVHSWSQLIPVLRQIGAENPRHSTLALLTLITASDALQTLDKLGPTFGLDISMDGLRRLARMLNASPQFDPLQYDDALDPELQKLFRFPQPDANDSGVHIDLWPIGQAQAAVDRPLQDWLPKPGQLQPYLLRIRKLLVDHAKRQLARSRLADPQQTLYKHLVMATAWQESCWRQYVVDGKKIVPLHSTTGDTGIMQVNEKVWRGFVDVQKLRWEVAYNIQFGSQVLLDYLTRYALKSGEHKHPGGLDNLARASYSAYNGGPGQISRYRNGKSPKAHRLIDQSFHKKYQAVKKGEELAVAKCLGDDTVQAAATTGTPGDPAARPAKPAKKTKLIQRDSWIKRQSNKDFTLQLGAFSSTKAANAFIRQQKIAGTYAIFRQRSKTTAQFTVIYGRFSTRSNAERESRRFKPGKPWIRPFKDIHATMR